MTLRGDVDVASHDIVEGWAWDPDRPDASVSLVVLAGGAVLGRCLANRFRHDLLEAGIGDGRHAFVLQFRNGLSRGERHAIEVRREEDGLFVPGSPKVVEASLAFDKAAADHFARILSAAETDEEFEPRLAFLLDQTEKLRARYSRRSSGLAARERRRRLARQGPAEISANMPAPGASRPLALVIDDRLPDLARDAGSKAIVSHIQSLQRLGFDVSFAPADMAGDGRALEALGVACHAKPWVNSVEELLERRRGAYQLVYLHRFSNAYCYLSLVRRLQPRARVIYGLADLHHLRLAREAAVEQRDDLARHSEWLKRQELWFAAQADAVVTHSSAERDILRRHIPPGNIFVAPWVVAPKPTAARFDQRKGVCFLAYFGHRPNVDAAQWLIQTIMPQVWEVDPGVVCYLAGRDMPNHLRRLASDRVVVLGAVADLSELFDRVRLTVAPLVFGAGIKGKVLDSLAAGLPCVCTLIAAEGLDFPDPLVRFVGKTAPELAQAIVALHNDEKLNAETAAAGLDFIRAFASEKRVDAALARAADLPPDK